MKRLVLVALLAVIALLLAAALAALLATSTGVAEKAAIAGGAVALVWVAAQLRRRLA